MINSINTNIAAYYAQANIGNASNAASSSVSRLSSGNRIVKASDDVAALSAGTSLRTNVTTLRTALINTTQGSSLLQVADGALSQITDILQRQKAIAVQAGSGSLSSNERAYLNQEFTSLTSEVDRLVGQTNFNGVKLLDGSLSQAAEVKGNTNAASKGTQSINFVDNISAGESLQIGGVTLVAGSTSSGNTFAVGASLSETVSNLAERLNSLAGTAANATSLGQASYSASGSTLNITALSGGSLSNNFAVNTTQSVKVSGINKVTTGTQVSGATLATIELGTNHGFQVGQKIFVSGAGTVDGLALDKSFTITAVSANSVTFNSGQTATAGAQTGGIATTTVSADSAISRTEASINGGYTGSSFNLFAATTGLSSANTVVSANASTATGTTSFQNGDSISAQINGVTKTLYTFGASGDSGSRTLKDVVDGINANADSTGIKAALAYDQASSTYNIRLNYDTQASNVIFSTGTNYNSTILGLNGATVDTDGVIDGAAAAARNTAVAYTGYVDLLATSIGAVASTATVIGATATAPFVVGNSITATINGKTETLHTFVAGDGFDDIIASINSKSAQTGVYAAITGTAADVDNIRLFLTDPGASGKSLIKVSTGGAVGNAAGNPSTATQATVTGATLTQVSNYGLKGGADNGVGLSSVTVNGTLGDSILTGLSQTKPSSSLILTQNPVAGNNITVGGQVFTFTTNATRASNEILIGSSLKDTLDNAISTLNNYLGNGDALGNTAYVLNQLNVTRSDNSLVFTGKSLGSVKTLAGVDATIAATVTGASLTNSGSLATPSTTFGVDTTGVSNLNFAGKLQGFSATYKSTDTADLSIKVGSYTYTAKDVDLTNSSNTTVRLFSNNTSDGSNGGYFDLQLKANEVLSFSSQGGADVVANRLNAAFSSVNFLQNRNISSYNGSQTITANNTVIGSLVGSKVSAQLDNFEGLKVTSLKVSAPQGSNTNGSISIVVNGETFATSNNLGSTLGANQTYRLTSADNASKFIDFTTGNSSVNFSSADNAAAVEKALQGAFGVNADAASLKFQVGVTTTDTLSIGVNNVDTNTIFSGKKLDVLTQESAATAASQLDTAIGQVTNVRASIGALQSRFNFAAANIESSIQNQDAARGALLDTDIAAESTNYATSQVKLQAGISVLAQANQQLQSLLKLLG